MMIKKWVTGSIASAIAATFYMASMTPLFAQQNFSLCDGLTGASFGLCRAGIAAGCDQPDPTLKTAKACERIEAQFETFAGTPPPWIATENTVFVTSMIYTGFLGGLAEADSICNQHASAAGLAGEYKAWLSSESVSASDRLNHATVPYVRVDGVAVANNWGDLTDGMLSAPIIKDENNMNVLISS